MRSSVPQFIKTSLVSSSVHQPVHRFPPQQYVIDTTALLLISPPLPVGTSEKYENLTELLMSTSEILKFGARSAQKKIGPFLQFSRRKRSKNGPK